jgi:hypothetical protein
MSFQRQRAQVLVKGDVWDVKRFGGRPMRRSMERWRGWRPRATDVSQLSPDTGDFVPGFRHPIRPLEEQHAIAVFLDCETVRIDALIEKIGRSIDLLPEYSTLPAWAP